MRFVTRSGDPVSRCPPDRETEAADELRDLVGVVLETDLRCVSEDMEREQQDA
jgi:hypothetical protein